MPSSGCNTATNCIEFYADVVGRKAYPGGGAEDRVRITNVDLGDTTSAGCSATNPCFNNPPYTLMRFTLDANGNQVDTPLANNIRSIHFDYYPNVTGVAPTTAPANWSALTQVGTNATGGAGQYDPAQPANGLAQRAARQQIKSVRVQLVGMNESPEPNYQNPKEATTSYAYRYRTYRLESLLVPRNLGKQGVREIPPTPPGAPVLQTITTGYCGAVRLDWLAPSISPGQGQVESYKILYNDQNNGVFPYVVNVGPNVYGFVTGLTPTTTYYFTVAAVNSYGSQIALIPGTQNTQVISGQPLNTTSPGAPTALAASGGGGSNPPAEANDIRLTWTPPAGILSGFVTVKTVSGSTTTSSTNINEVFGEVVTYNVWRTRVATDVCPGGGNCRLISTTSFPQNSLSLTSTTGTFIDKSEQNCITYYYFIQAVEQCGQAACSGCNQGGAVGTSPVPPKVSGVSTATSAPAAPATITVDTTASTCGGARCDVYLQFSKVKLDTSTPPNAIVVGAYQLVRERWVDGALDTNTTPNGQPVVTIPVPDNTPFTGLYVSTSDLNIPSKGPGPLGPSEDYTYYYRVQALQCPDTASPPNYSFASDINASPTVAFPCPFSAAVPTVGVSLTLDGDGLSASTAWLTNNPASQVLVTGTGLSSVQAILDSGTQLVNLGTLTSPNQSPNTYVFPLAGTDVGEIYQLYVIAKDSNGCLKQIIRWVEEATPTGCCLANAATDASVVSYTPGTNFVDITFHNLCAQNLGIVSSGSLQLTWDPVIARSGNTGLSIQLNTVEFPSTGTGAAIVTVNDNAGTTGITPRNLTINASAASPAADLNVPLDSATYSIRIKFNATLNNSQSPITSACVIYQRSGIDTSNQNCRIIGTATSFNSCN